MGKWNKTCYSFQRVRELLETGEETVYHCKKIMAALVACCNELIPDDPDLWVFTDEFTELKNEILDEMELMCSEDEYEECEDMVNHYLREMYDLCDAAKVWLPL